MYFCLSVRLCRNVRLWLSVCICRMTCVCLFSLSRRKFARLTCHNRPRSTAHPFLCPSVHPPPYLSLQLSLPVFACLSQHGRLVQSIYTRRPWSEQPSVCGATTNLTTVHSATTHEDARWITRPERHWIYSCTSTISPNRRNRNSFVHHHYIAFEKQIAHPFFQQNNPQQIGARRPTLFHYDEKSIHWSLLTRLYPSKQ